MDIKDQLQVNPEDRLPLVLQLSQQITWLIASEVIKEGEQLPPIRVLAEALDIHMHTVRAAYLRLQSLGLVSVRTKQGSIVLPFHPKRLALQAPSSPSYLIGVLMPEPSPVYRSYLEAIQREALNGHRLPIIVYNYDDPHLTERALRQLLAMGVDGLIITSAVMGEAIFKLLKGAPKLPKVFVDAPQIQVNSLLPDSEGASYLATEHLLDHGHDAIAMLTAPLSWENVVPCFHGYTKAHADRGQTPPETWLVQTSGFSREAGFQAARELLCLTPRPHAVFVAADDLAIGALDAFREAGLEVPVDIAVASYNDTEAAGLVSPGLTSATLPGEKIGRGAVDLLIDLMEGGEPLQSPQHFESELIIRQSCGCQS